MPSGKWQLVTMVLRSEPSRFQQHAALLVLSLDTPLPTYERWEEAPYDATAVAIREYSVTLEGVHGTVIVLKPLRQSKAVSSPDLKPGGMCPVRQLRRAEPLEPSTLETRRWRQLRAAV